MAGEKVQPLAKRWQDGVRLLHASAKAQSNPEAADFMAQEVAWAAGAIEDAEPWPALHARLEPLGGLEVEEQRILMGMSAQDANHAMSLICLAVRLHRIAAWLDSMATVAASGSSKIDMSAHIALARVLWDGGAKDMTLTEAARQAVEQLGYKPCANEDAAIQYVRKRITDLPVRFG